MKKVFAGFLIIFGSFNLLAQSKITKEEYKVYSKIFESIYEKRKVAPDFQIVILDNTTKQILNSKALESRSKTYFSDKTNPYFKDFDQQKIKELLKDYIEKNTESALIKEKLKTKYNYVVISQYKLNNLLLWGRKLYDEMPEKPVDELHSPRMVWKPFLNNYRTDGCYSFSRVGFSKDKKLALVFLSRSEGIMGDEILYILEKNNGQWLTPQFFGYRASWII